MLNQRCKVCQTYPELKVDHLGRGGSARANGIPRTLSRLHRATETLRWRQHHLIISRSLQHFSAEVYFEFKERGRYKMGDGKLCLYVILSMDLVLLSSLLLFPFESPPCGELDACGGCGCHLPHIAPPAANFLSLVALSLFALGTSD